MTLRLVFSLLQDADPLDPAFEAVVAAGNRLSAGTTRLTHTTPPATRLEDIPPKTGEMDVAEFPCIKFLTENEKKRKKAEAKAAAKANIRQGMATRDKGIVVTAEKGVPDRSAIKRLWWLLCQSMQQKSNVLLRFENLSEEHASLVYAHESCKEIKARYKECKKEMGNICSEYDENRVKELDGEKKGLEDVNAKQMDHIRQLEGELEKFEAKAHQLRWKRENFDVLYENGDVVRQKIIKDYLPTFVRRLHQSAEYKQSLGEVFSLAIGKGFINGISIGQKEEDIQAILVETPNMDHTALATFMEKNKAPFDKRLARPSDKGLPPHPQHQNVLVG
ncbi:hypothetical protein Tco_1425401 [Tanacetum coccineum]